MKNRAKIWIGLAGVLMLAGLAGLASWPKGPDIDLTKIKIPFKRELKLHLGLDLEGGAHLTYDADLSRVKPENYADALEGVRDVIERRVNALGVSEPVVQTNHSGDSYRIIIELAGVFDINRAIEMIGQTPSLDFREQTGNPSPDFDMSELRLEGEGENAQLVDKDGKPVDLAKLQEAQSQAFQMTNLTGKQLAGSQVQLDQQTGSPTISLEFNDEGRQLFEDITSRNVGKPLAIYLDGEAISAPVVNEKISGGKAVISGQFTLEEAQDLSRRLNAGALPVPITLVGQQTVGASLGATSIEKSFFAGLLGLVAVMVFMIVNYRFPGLVASLALMIYCGIVLALFKLIPVTMTLAGIAGFIMSIGVAVDANVLIFERLKEELKSGKSLALSIEQGFKSAWPSIRDSNLTTLISCVILIKFSTSVVQGFAITLLIGVLCSMFSAIMITRSLLIVAPHRFFLKHPKLLGIDKNS